MSATILIVDDEESIVKALGGILEDEGFKTVSAGDGIEALAVAQRETPDLVMLDIWMPRMEGLETLQRLKELYPELIVIMMSGHGTIETAVKSTRMGAYDFIEKPLSLEKVILSINNALGVNRLREENASLRGLVFKEHELIGASQPMKRLQELITVVAPTTASVLLSGENGTGKEFLARSIHVHSQRRDKPFIEINCAAIPEELIESELFGHEKGFSGAATQKKGKFHLADGGTIFLDGIGEISLKTQAKVLRVLQEGKFERLGGMRSSEVDVRVIAATNKMLEQEVKAGRFREDLWYRLNVVPFNIPPLRDRKEDIPLLVEHFLEVFCRSEGRESRAMAPEALQMMKNYDWPGNVRELKNVIERLVIMTTGIITDEHFPAYLVGKIDGQELVGRPGDSCCEISSLREAREEFEKDFILRKLAQNGWNIAKTADAIETERSNLHRKIKSYGINLKE